MTGRHHLNGTSAGGTLRYLAIIIPIIVAVLVFVAWMVGRTATLADEVAANEAVIGTLVEDGEAVQEQVRELGEEPVAPPPEERVDEPTDSVPGPRGPVGQQGLRGNEGRGVASMTCTADGRWLVTFTDGATQTASGPCQGIPGADSTVPGPKGDPGEDSTVPGPAGQDSTVPGPAGPAGQPPLSWTFTFPDGKLHVCVRTDPFDPAAPTYVCTVSQQQTE